MIYFCMFYVLYGIFGTGHFWQLFVNINDNYNNYNYRVKEWVFFRVIVEGYTGE